jgi:hypothetical protein
VFGIEKHEQRLIEENLLSLPLTEIMLVSVLPTVASIPIETRDQLKIDHGVCVIKIYGVVKTRRWQAG